MFESKLFVRQITHRLLQPRQRANQPCHRWRRHDNRAERPDKDLSGLNRDPNKAHEITKDDQTNMHVYVNPSVIADIANGGKGLINSYGDLYDQTRNLVNDIRANTVQLLAA